jgi:hypothetical protein
VNGLQIVGNRAGEVLCFFDAVVVAGSEVVSERANILLGYVREDVLALEVLANSFNDCSFLRAVEDFVLPFQTGQRSRKNEK